MTDEDKYPQYLIVQKMFAQNKLLDSHGQA